MKRSTWLLAGSVFLWAILGSLAVPAAAQVSVTSANPNNAPQGSTNLIVKIGGSGFKRQGNAASFFVTGTTNPGGITVNSVAFVNSKEVDANITVSSTATVSGFDVYVTSGGRTGKGTDLFAVTANSNGGGQDCVTQGPAPGWTQVGVLNTVDSNGTPLYTFGHLGLGVRVQLVSAPDANGNIVPQFYVGLAGAGAVAFILNLDGTVRRSWEISDQYGTRDIEVGDVNGDGAPDFVIGHPGGNLANVMIGHLTGSAGSWDYNIDPATDVFTLSSPAGTAGDFGFRVAMGDLDGDGKDEVAVVDQGVASGKHKSPGTVYIYRFSQTNSTWTLMKQITDPGGSGKFNGFGTGLGIAELTEDASGNRLHDLAVAARNTNLVYIFQDPLGSGSFATLALPLTDIDQAGAADVTGDGFPDLVAVSGPSGDQAAEVVAGPLQQNSSPLISLMPNPDLAGGWATGFGLGDVDGDGAADVLVGAPNSTYGSSCSSLSSSGSGGAAYVFRTGSSTFPSSYSDLFEIPSIDAGDRFGWSVAAAPFNNTIGQPIVLIGQNGATVGTQADAGQVYIYRKTQ